MTQQTIRDLMQHHRDAFGTWALDPDSEETARIDWTEMRLVQRCQEVADRIRRILPGMHPDVLATTLAVAATVTHSAFDGDRELSPGLWTLGMVAYMTAPAGVPR